MTTKKAKENNELRNKYLEQRHNDLIEDEKWKTINCKACPHCNRPIQKMEGCDSMVCGKDAHGGNVQQGCGKQFAWSSSKAYVSDIANAFKREEITLSLPTEPTKKKSKQNMQCLFQKHRRLIIFMHILRRPFLLFM